MFEFKTVTALPIPSAPIKLDANALATPMSPPSVGTFERLM
jgi:hypothetical protein